MNSAMFVQWNEDSMMKIQFTVTNEQINFGKVIATSNEGDFTPVRIFEARILNVLSTRKATQKAGRSSLPITSF